MNLLELTFLGTFKVTIDGRPVTKFRSSNVRGLLAYLALKGTQPVERETLTALFWPEQTERMARMNLRQTIYQLRKSLGDNKDESIFLLVDRRSVQLNPDADIRVDVTRFLQAIEQDDIEAAGILFGGELLPGISNDSAVFEQWLTQERERINRLALDVLSKLTEAKLASADFTAAKDAALKQLKIEPWREMAHFQLMQALALSGEREAAIAQFEELEDLLEQELGRSPTQETFDLLIKIENNELGPTLGLTELNLPPPFQAPAVPDYLTGRDDEIEIISNLLTAEVGRKEIVALVGMGGIGKTTLAAAVANRLREHFVDGILWGNTLLSSAENILEVWAQAYGRDYSSISDLESLSIAVRSLLAHKKVLIVLDNVTPTADLSPLLQPGSDCSIIMTTRSHDAAAAVNAEIIPVKELTTDSSSFMIQQILDQKKLFEEEEARKAAEKIGDLLEHLPLAVEITAQLLKARPRMTLHSMVERLQDAQQRRGLQISNKAVRASFELSWEMLNEELRTLFSNIGIFEGRSFTLEAIQSTVDTDTFTTEDNLYTLVSLSLVKLDGENRFKQHPLLADFAAEKQNHKKLTLEKIVRFYKEFSKTNALNYEMLQSEWGNIFYLINECFEYQFLNQIKEFQFSLIDSWLKFGQYKIPSIIFNRFISKFGFQIAEEELAIIYLNWAQIEIKQSNYEIASENLNHCLTALEYTPDNDLEAKVYFHQAYIFFEQGNFSSAKIKLDESLNLCIKNNSEIDLARSLDLLAKTHFEIDSDTSTAEKLGLEALSIWEKHPHSEGLCSTLRLLCVINIRKSNFQEANTLISKALEMAISINHKQEQGSAYHLLLGINSRIDKLDLAEEQGLLGLKLVKQIGNKRYEGMILHELSAVLYKKNNLKGAESMCTNAIEIFDTLNDKLGVGYAHLTLGDIYHAKELSKQAKDIWEQAFTIANSLSHVRLSNLCQQRLFPNE